MMFIFSTTFGTARHKWTVSTFTGITSWCHTGTPKSLQATREGDTCRLKTSAPVSTPNSIPTVPGTRTCWSPTWSRSEPLRQVQFRAALTIFLEREELSVVGFFPPPARHLYEILPSTSATLLHASFFAWGAVNIFSTTHPLDSSPHGQLKVPIYLLLLHFPLQHKHKLHDFGSLGYLEINSQVKIMTDWKP